MSTLWIDAVEFDNPGGFLIESQFVPEIGQSYLLALGTPGIPVQPADTSFIITEAGYYRVWIRTKNWYPAASPGTLQVSVNNQRLAHESGRQPSRLWYWEIAGDIKLMPGSHTLQVKDTSGYFGRFADIVISSDPDFVPDPRPKGLLQQRLKYKGFTDQVIDEGLVDLVVCGAGPGGIPAALAAARHGLKVALINARPCIGGNASEEGTIGLDGAACAHPYYRESGIAEEVRRIKEQRQISWQKAFEALLTAEKNIRLYNHQFVIDADNQDDVIRSVETLHSLKGSRHRFRAAYFIDATGDGWLGFYAGAKYRLGREGKWQYSERFAPESGDTETMSGCLTGSWKGQQILGFFAEEQAQPVSYNAPSWAVSLPEGNALHRSPHRLNTGEWWIENPTNWDDLWEQEEVRDELLRLNLGYFHWLKNSYTRRDLTRNLQLVGFGRYNARRESRRLIGDYVLTQQDCETGARFPDAIGYCGWPLDVHHPQGIYSGAEGPFFSNAPVKITDIPYRCLYSVNISNLFMAGRCLSVSHLALGSVRVEGTLASLGQAAGTAAALCLKSGLCPRELGQKAIQSLQQTLLQDDLFIPDHPARDAADFARQAHVRASSVSLSEQLSQQRGLAGPFDNISSARFAAFPRAAACNRAWPRLKNMTSQPVKITASLYLLPQGNIEQRQLVETLDFSLEGGFNDFAKLPFRCFSLKQPELPDQPLALILEACPEISWQELNYCSDGRQRGFPLNELRWQQDGSNTYNTIWQETAPIIADCSPQQIINGWNRPLDADRYLWASSPQEGLPQWIELVWPETKDLTKVQLVFDSDLIHPAYSYLSRPVVRGLVRDYKIEALQDDGSWSRLLEQKDNIQRHQVHTFPVVHTRSLRITISAVWDSQQARICEVRAYS